MTTSARSVTLDRFIIIICSATFSLFLSGPSGLDKLGLLPLPFPSGQWGRDGGRGSQLPSAFLPKSHVLLESVSALSLVPASSG